MNKESGLETQRQARLVSRSQTLIPTGKGLARRVKKTGLASRDCSSLTIQPNSLMPTLRPD